METNEDQTLYPSSARSLHYWLCENTTGTHSPPEKIKRQVNHKESPCALQTTSYSITVTFHFEPERPGCWESHHYKWRSTLLNKRQYIQNILYVKLEWQAFLFPVSLFLFTMQEKGDILLIIYNNRVLNRFQIVELSESMRSVMDQDRESMTPKMWSFYFWYSFGVETVTITQSKSGVAQYKRKFSFKMAGWWLLPPIETPGGWRLPKGRSHVL